MPNIFCISLRISQIMTRSDFAFAADRNAQNFFLDSLSSPTACRAPEARRKLVSPSNPSERCLTQLAAVGLVSLGARLWAMRQRLDTADGEDYQSASGRHFGWDTRL